jgi:hypothetical protein
MIVSMPWSSAEGCRGAGRHSRSFRLPGSETSIRVYGFAEANLIKDFKGTAPGDNFSNLAEQPLGKSDNGKTVLTGQTSRFGFETSTPMGNGAFNTKIEADFYGYCGSECNRNRLRLRHAYGEYAGWLIGQTGPSWTWTTCRDGGLQRPSGCHLAPPHHGALHLQQPPAGQVPVRAGRAV